MAYTVKYRGLTVTCDEIAEVDRLADLIERESTNDEAVSEAPPTGIRGIPVSVHGNGAFFCYACCTAIKDGDEMTLIVQPPDMPLPTERPSGAPHDDSIGWMPLEDDGIINVLCCCQTCEAKLLQNRSGEDPAMAKKADRVELVLVDSQPKLLVN